MNAYSTLAAAKRLESAGLTRKHAEALATEFGTAMGEHVTKEQMEAALNRHTILICGVLGTLLALGFTALGLVISLHS